MALLGLIPVLVLAACGTDGDAADGPTVVVSTNVLGDIVENVVGDNATVEVLIPVGADPHDYALSSAQAADMQNADLVVVNGLGLEEGMLDVIESLEEDGANVLEIGPGVDPLPFGDASECDPDEAHHHEDEDHEEGDHEEGDHDGAAACDPHVWMDPIRMIQAVRQIEAALEALDESVDWSTGADAYVSVLEGLHTEVEALLGGIPSANRKLVTNHDAVGYLASRYELEVVGVVIPGGSTLADPSSSELAELVHVMEEEGANVIFADTSAPDDLADAVATEVGEDVSVVDLYTGSLGEPGSEAGTYVGMIRTDAMRIANALG